MLRRTTFGIGMLMISSLIVAQVWAHTPLCSCYDNGDGTVTCEGGFSDGSSAAGVQSGSPASQEVVAVVDGTVSRPGAGGPEGAPPAAETATHIAKRSSAGRVAGTATDRIRRVVKKPCSTWWFPTTNDTADPLPRCGP
jgi:hypothetical protein